VFNMGMSEIVVILVVALVFLGPKKLPELASGLGKMIRELRKATADIKSEIELDETIRKPVEELREAMTLHPEELKRRDVERAARAREERERQERERLEKQASEAEAKKAAATAAATPAAAPSAGLDADRTIAMESPPPGMTVGAPSSPAAVAAGTKVPGAVPRPTLTGVPAPLPRSSVPPPPPAAARLPPPPAGIRPLPPPVKKV
jgi:Tat protein translocase TatB subunit